MANLLSRLTLSKRFLLMTVISALGFSLTAAWILDDSLYRERQVATRHAVEVAHSVVERYVELASRGTLTEAQAQQAARETVSKLRYEHADYFWINDMTPRMVMHPMKPALDGKPLSEMRDPNGVALFMEMVDVCRRHGGGFVAYDWPRPGSEDPIPKISYVKLVRRWGWVVGSGVYVDDIRSSVFELMAWFGVIVVVVMGLSLALARSTVRSVQRMTGRLSESADQLGATVAQLSSGSDQVSRGAQEHAAALQETSASMTELEALTRSNAEAAAHAASVVSRVDSELQSSNVHIGELVTAMGDISEASGRVSKIIKAIDEIAFQTNLLALNAAVEAARAGDAGKGFAVVANEVRTLAQRAATAAHDTSELIESSVAATGTGVERAERVAAEIKQLTAATAEVKTLVENISLASSQQAIGLGQMTTAVGQMERVVQGNAAVAEESAAAGAELLSQAETTKDVVRELDAIVVRRNLRHAA